MTNSACIVIGGGISGLIIATLLQRAEMKVTVLDKGRGIGGRLATRRLHSELCTGIFDYGAQYFSVKQPEFQVWVDEWLQQGVIKEWCQGFGVVDSKPRYCGVNGIRGIAKYLAQNLSVYTSTRVVELNYADRWQVYTENKQQFEGDILVMTPPVPQSLALLDNSQIALPADIRTSLEQITYHSCIAILGLLEQPSKIPAPGGLTLETEPLIWLASNHQKGISPDGYAVTLQATPSFSQTHWEYSDRDLAQELFASASKWLDSPVIEYQVHRWRYSLPATFYSQPYLALSELPLVMAGDAFVAPKLEGAVLSAIAAAEYISKVAVSM
jgi:renalase